MTVNQVWAGFRYIKENPHLPVAVQKIVMLTLLAQTVERSTPKACDVVALFA